MKTKSRKQSKENHIDPKDWLKVGKLYEACLNNAKDLADEAEILYQNKCYARATALAILALEEIGKSQIVADFFNGMASKTEFDDAFKKHEIKSAYNWRKFLLDTSTIEYNPSEGRKYHEWRMDAMYVDCLKNYQAQEPKNIFTKEDARKSIEFVNKEINDIITMEYLSERIGSKSFMK